MSVLQNDGFQELSYKELFTKVTHTVPNNIIVKHNLRKFVPRKIPPNFIPKINHFSRAKDDLLYCIIIDQTINYEGENYPKRYYFSPSMTLYATLQREDEKGIRKILGQYDNLSNDEENKIEEIIKYLKTAQNLETWRMLKNSNTLSPESLNRYKQYISQSLPIERKRLDQILNDEGVKTVYFNGHAYNVKVKSKQKDEIYSVDGKQFFKFENDRLKVPAFLDVICECGFNISSKLKYEFQEQIAACSHLELTRHALTYPNYFRNKGAQIRFDDKITRRNITKINDLFTPFNLDFINESSKELRTIIRKGLHASIVPQEYIKNNYNDSNRYHKTNGFTLFRCELDAYLLSFKEVYNKEFFNLWMRNINPRISEKFTCEFYGDMRVIDTVRNNRITHYYNKDKKMFEHHLNHNWIKTNHYATINEKTGPLLNDQFKHTPQGEHIITDSSIIGQAEIFHTLNVYEPFIEFEKPFDVGVLNPSLKCYLGPYKMRDSKN